MPRRRRNAPHAAATKCRRAACQRQTPTFQRKVGGGYGKKVVVQAVIAPCDEALRQSIFAAAQHIEKYHPPEGKKWLAFYRKKMKFDTTQISNEEDSDIKIQVKHVIDAVADDAAKIFATIAAELPKEDAVT